MLILSLAKVHLSAVSKEAWGPVAMQLGAVPIAPRLLKATQAKAALLPSSSEGHQATRRNRKGNAKEVAKHQSCKESISCSKDTGTVLLWEIAPEGGGLNKIQRAVQKTLESPLDSGRKPTGRSRGSRNHQGSSSEKHEFMRRVAHYLPEGVHGAKAKELRLRSERELKTSPKLLVTFSRVTWQPAKAPSCNTSRQKSWQEKPTGRRPLA